VPAASLLRFLITDLLGNIHQLWAGVAEDMVIFHLLLKSPYLFRVSESTADRFSLLLTEIEGVGADKCRNIQSFSFGFRNLAGD